MTEPTRPPIDIAALARQSIALTQARPKALSSEQQTAEIARCREDLSYFIFTYCKIYDNDTEGWIAFGLWDSQRPALELMITQQWLTILKARQLGLTWLALAYVLWRMRFWPIASWLFFSLGEVEALELLSDDRLRGMYAHLPDWMKLSVIGDNKSEFKLSNDSRVIAIPSSRGGDSRTLTGVLIDECDLIDNVTELITRAEPTLGQNGKMFLISRAYKKKPNSTFKRLYNQAVGGASKWKALFLPWSAHPKRTRAWYEAKCAEEMEREGTLDGIFEQYPATPEEAMAERSLDKRINGDWISALYSAVTPIAHPEGAPALHGLIVYRLPHPGRSYAIGADPAEGNPGSDDSVACVVDAETLEEMATLAGKIEPTTFANSVVELSVYYNEAPILPERNNHGHLMIARLRDKSVTVRNGLDGKLGWHTNAASKVRAYDDGVEALSALLRAAKLESETPLPIFHSPHTSAQLRSIDANTLKAPEGYPDDYAVAWVLANRCAQRGVSSVSQTNYTGLYSRRDARREGRLPVQLPKQIPPLAPSPGPAPASEQDEEQAYLEYIMRVRFRN